MVRLFGHYFRARVVSQVLFDTLLVLVLVLAQIVAVAESFSLVAPAAGFKAFSYAAGVSLINSFSGLYDKADRLTREQLLGRAVVASLLAVPLALALFALLPVVADGLLVSFAAAAGAVGVVLRRAYLSRRVGSKWVGQRVLIFGCGAAAVDVARSIAETDPMSVVVGYYPGPNEVGSSVPLGDRLSTEKSLCETAKSLGADEIVVALAERRAGSMPLRELLECKVRGVRVFDLASYFERTRGQIRIDYVNAGWMIFGEGFRQGAIRRMAKRVFDVLSSSVLLLLAAPVMAVAALAIVLESKGPVLYRQQRVGKDGKTFMISKFRSMRVDAESDGMPRWATANDSRVTRVGRFIRLCRIDELPQLFNVLRGEMSLVGPRPERPFFVDQLTSQIPYFQVRHSVKPGLTGWAQVSHSYASSVDDAMQKLQFDLYYVKNNSLFLDIVIMFKTVVVVLTGKGAC